MSQPANTPPLEIEIRPLAVEDYPYIRHTWREAVKKVRKYDRMPWPLYKQTVGKVIDGILVRDDVAILAAYAGDGRVVGWVAYQQGPTVSTLLYVYTRFASGEVEWRRRGIASTLLEAAELGKRIVYCFHSSRLHRAASTEDVLLRMAEKRGVSATYVPVEEFVR